MPDIIRGTTKHGAEFVKLITEVMSKTKGFELCMDKVKITNGGCGHCLAQFTVAKEHLNRRGTLHGGFTASLIDMITTFALISKPSVSGVSVNMNVNFLRAAKEGDEILVNARTIRAGKTLALIECKLRLKKDESIIAIGNQTKYVGSGKAEQNTATKEPIWNKE